MSEFTTIQIKKDVKQRLDLVKGENRLNYNTIIEKLLEQSGGRIVEDVITIKREQIAFTLKYWDNERQINNDVSYVDLSKSKIGDEFIACENPTGDKWVNSGAKVVARDGDEIILIAEEVNFDAGEVSSFKSVVHVSLF